MMSRRVLLSLGSNIDPAEQRVREAIRHLSEHVLTDVTESPLYRTPPLGYTDQQDFINAAIVGTYQLDSHSLHKAVKGLEVSLGRRHRDQWREREIDIDIILFGSDIVTDLLLQIPHPRFRERRFVLTPAAYIAPDFIDPVTGKTLQQLLQTCPDASELTRL